MLPSSETKIKALSLFSGAGGLDLGAAQAGADVRASIEIDPHCCDTLRHWHQATNTDQLVIEGDIRSIDPITVAKQVGLERGELDLLMGGPPCQSFSQIGKRKSLDDERGMLLFEVIRFAKELKPHIILLEQVKGLLNAKDHTGQVGGVFKQFISELQGLGYKTTWRVLTAADYGVAQVRQRVFVVATDEKYEFKFPEPTHSRDTYVSVGSVISDLPRPHRVDGEPPLDSHADVTPAGDLRRIKGVPEGSCLAAQLHLPAEQRGRLTKKDTTKFRRLANNLPSLTLRGGELFYHPSEDRYLTPREYMRIHGYPDEYKLKGPIRGRTGQPKNLDQHRQVANSVPPPLAKAIVSEIIRTLDARDI